MEGRCEGGGAGEVGAGRGAGEGAADAGGEDGGGGGDERPPAARARRFAPGEEVGGAGVLDGGKSGSNPLAWVRAAGRGSGASCRCGAGVGGARGP